MNRVSVSLPSAANFESSDIAGAVPASPAAQPHAYLLCKCKNGAFSNPSTASVERLPGYDEEAVKAGATVQGRFVSVLTSVPNSLLVGTYEGSH